MNIISVRVKLYTVQIEYTQLIYEHKHTSTAHFSRVFHCGFKSVRSVAEISAVFSFMHAILLLPECR